MTGWILLLLFPKPLPLMWEVVDPEDDGGESLAGVLLGTEDVMEDVMEDVIDAFFWFGFTPTEGGEGEWDRRLFSDDEGGARDLVDEEVNEFAFVLLWFWFWWRELVMWELFMWEGFGPLDDPGPGILEKEEESLFWGSLELFMV